MCGRHDYLSNGLADKTLEDTGGDVQFEIMLEEVKSAGLWNCVWSRPKCEEFPLGWGGGWDRAPG